MASTPASKTSLPSVALRRLATAFLYHSWAAGGLTEGTNAATVKTANTVTYFNAGVYKTKAATDNIAVPAGTAVGASKFCKFLVTLADGTFTITQGNVATTAALAELPAVPALGSPVGYFQIATGGATTYTPGTTDNGAAGVTDTYADITWPDSGESMFDLTVS